jgi:phenylpropionate dioxygenase-like ring-hydroxylating dioxygenase large terminal subunit
MTASGNVNRDTGTAYGYKPGKSFDELTLVGPGTPMGELMRRYWQPLALADSCTHTPRKIKALGEDLILFRDRKGRPGLLYPRCMHRGTSLYYGRTEEEGIRCCFHGWLFDVQGNVLQQPCEPEGGKHRDRVRQPWYPVQERYGLIFAYMGPLERRPVLPRYAAIENLAADERVVAENQGYYGRGPKIVPCNWLQFYETNVDQSHISILHGLFSGTQFTDKEGNPASFMKSEQTIEWTTTETSVLATATRTLDDGRIYDRVAEARVPNVRGIPDPFFGDFGHVTHVHWTLPIDDTHFTAFQAYKDKIDSPRNAKSYFTGQVLPGGKTYDEMTEEEHREFPDDYEAQVSAGAITLHSEEHFVSQDVGVAQWRRLLRRQLKVIADGGDPVGVSFCDVDEPINPQAGAFFR